jgi:long-chain acyl-CoA synthetase
MNLTANLKRSAAEHPDKVAVRLEAAELSYAELADSAARMAGWLQSVGVQAGDRVGVMLPNVPPMAVAYYGVLWAGAIVVPMNPLYKFGEIAHVISDAGAKAIVVWDGVVEEAGRAADEVGCALIEVSASGFEGDLAVHQPVESVERSDEHTAVVLYTSGTTGKPKGAELTHDNMARNADIAISLFGCGPDQVVFGGLPLFHAFGQTAGLNTSVASGATITLLPRFDPVKALELLQRDKVTIMLGVPTMYAAMLQHPDRSNYDVSALRLCVSGGSAMPVEVLRGFEEAFGVIILEGYGLSETSPIASFNHADRPRKPGSIGTPIDGVEFRLIDDAWRDAAEGEIGEIAIRGHNVMKGYLGRPDETEKVINDGWFRTGDLARKDEDGYYFIVDRSKDLIIRGGYNVYPREVEELLYQHPSVAAAAVIGVPHDQLGEEIAAAVVLKPAADATEEELKDFVKTRIAAYKYPRVVWITDALPIGPTGKILKRNIRIPGHSA